VCGLGGVYHFRTQAPAEAPLLQRLGARLQHRGPDGEGMFRDGPLGFVHRRLAVIDLEGGAQPMTASDGGTVICYNGEVYNFVELFDELRALGHRPRTHSDTEAVMLAYAQWGLDFPRHLNGMFAVALWDVSRRRLVLCRDRLGIKPLYYAETPDGIAFASEMKALIGLPGIDGALDLESLDEYLTLGYVVTPRCLVRGIRKLEPGTIMTVGADGVVERQRYWALSFRPDHAPSAGEWQERLRALFDDAVRLQLRSDVPLGVLLSGGVDSTAIATTVSRLQAGGHGVDTFCAGVDLPGELNEFEWARLVARRIGSRHHEERLTSEQYGALLVEAARCLDEPLVEPLVAQLLGVCRLARTHVTVVLSGEGSDETWFGYDPYRWMYAIEVGQRLVPGPLLRRLPRFLDVLASRLPLSAKNAKHLRHLAQPLERRYLGLSFFDTSVKDTVCGNRLRSQLEGRDARESLRRLYDEAGGPETISRMAAVDCRAWLVDNTLLRCDLISMATSLELRVPFLDHRLVEFAARVPVRRKVGLRGGKVILKKALADRLPPEITRRRKVGFPTPIAALLRGPFGREARDLLLSPCPTTSDLFDRAVISRLLDEHRDGRNDWSRILFQLVMLEHWGRATEERRRA
jgi:asparagine synthase (glutamine-hydrolysing)